MSAEELTATSSGPEEVVLTGGDLTLEQVLDVARGHAPVVLGDGATQRMHRARQVLADVVAAGQTVYGVTVGVGSRANAAVDEGAASAFAQLLLRSHLIAQGPPAPPDVVRATALVLLNTLASGATMAGPELAERIRAALNADTLPPVRSLGSLGEADIAPMADLAVGVIGESPLLPGEGLVLLSNNAFSAGWAALAMAATHRLLGSALVAAALSFEGMQASIETLDPVAAAARPHPGLLATQRDLTELLAGSSLWDAPGGDGPAITGGPGREGARTHFHDPLSFRCTPQVHGAVLDAVAHARAQMEIELNAAQTNPFVDLAGGRILKVANFEALALALALDHVRIALASLVTTSAERALKLLQPAYTGLSDGLAAPLASAEDGLAEFDRVIYAIAAEARLLAAPVSYEVTGTSISQGIEDRMNLAALGARRLAEMVALCERVVALELVIAAQAVDLRPGIRLGEGTRRAHALVREQVPFAGAGQAVPPDLQPLVETVAAGAFTPRA